MQVLCLAFTATKCFQYSVTYSVQQENYNNPQVDWSLQQLKVTLELRIGSTKLQREVTMH